MYNEHTYLSPTVYRAERVREAENERLVRLTRQQPAQKRSLLARFAQYIGIFLVL